MQGFLIDQLLHGYSGRPARRTQRTRWSATRQGGNDPGLWWRFRFYAHTLGRFTEGEKHRPDVQTIEQAVAVLTELAGRAPKLPLMNENDAKWISEMFLGMAFQIQVGNLSGTHLSDDGNSYAWCLVERS